jgi:hypothetical protein
MEKHSKIVVLADVRSSLDAARASMRNVIKIRRPIDPREVCSILLFAHRKRPFQTPKP